MKHRIDTEEEWRRFIAGTILDRPVPTREPYAYLVCSALIVAYCLLWLGFLIGREAEAFAPRQKAPSGPTVELHTAHGVKTTAKK